MEYHKINSLINNCAKGCFKYRYSDYVYNNVYYSREFFCLVSPMASIPLEPKVLLISQSPSIQAWITAGKQNMLLDGGLVSRHNNFFIDDLLPAFGLDEDEIELFRETVAWVHVANCYPWFRTNGKDVRQDITPSQNDAISCIRQWLNRLVEMDSIKLIVLMGKPALELFYDLKEKGGKYTEYLRTIPILKSGDLPGKIFLPIFHQSKKSRLFNNEENRVANETAKHLLANIFKNIINDSKKQ